MRCERFKEKTGERTGQYCLDIPVVSSSVTGEKREPPHPAGSRIPHFDTRSIETELALTISVLQSVVVDLDFGPPDCVTDRFGALLSFSFQCDLFGHPDFF